MQYGLNLTKVSINHKYDRFSVPNEYKPKIASNSVGIIVDGNWNCDGIFSLSISTDGLVYFVSTVTFSGMKTLFGQLIYISV